MILFYFFLNGAYLFKRNYNMINYEMLQASRKKLVSLKELMEILKMSKMSVYRLCEKKELMPTTKYNGKIYFSGEDVYKFTKN